MSRATDRSERIEQPSLERPRSAEHAAATAALAGAGSAGLPADVHGFEQGFGLASSLLRASGDSQCLAERR